QKLKLERNDKTEMKVHKELSTEYQMMKRLDIRRYVVIKTRNSTKMDKKLITN
ncbi:1960_t:CDS:1, partial [Racocetra fulgida]